jgi:hypothetical protein
LRGGRAGDQESADEQHGDKQRRRAFHAAMKRDRRADGQPALADAQRETRPGNASREPASRAVSYLSIRM